MGEYKNPVPNIYPVPVTNKYAMEFNFKEDVTRKEAFEGIINLIKTEGFRAEWLYPVNPRYGTTRQCSDLERQKALIEGVEFGLDNNLYVAPAEMAQYLQIKNAEIIKTCMHKAEEDSEQQALIEGVELGKDYNLNVAPEDIEKYLEITSAKNGDITHKSC